MKLCRTTKILYIGIFITRVCLQIKEYLKDPSKFAKAAAAAAPAAAKEAPAAGGAKKEEEKKKEESEEEEDMGFGLFD